MYIAINTLQLLEQLIIDRLYDNYYISQIAFELYMMLSCYDMKHVLILSANDRSFEINIIHLSYSSIFV